MSESANSNLDAGRRHEKAHGVFVANDIETTVYIRGEGAVLEEGVLNMKYFRKRSFVVTSFSDMIEKVILELGALPPQKEGCEYLCELQPEHIGVWGFDAKTKETIEITEESGNFQIGGEYVALEKVYTLLCKLVRIVPTSASLPGVPINPDPQDPKSIMHKSLEAYTNYKEAEYGLDMAMQNLPRADYDVDRLGCRKALLDTYESLVRVLEGADDVTRVMFYPEDYDTQEERENAVEQDVEALKAAIEMLKQDPRHTTA